MARHIPADAAVFGVDLGKNIFHVVGLDARGAVVQRVKLRRETLLAFFERASRTLVGMEACPGSQWLARKLQAMGHGVRIVPAQFVKPYVKSQKNDTIDAEAIAEAVTRPTMRFTQIRTTEQVDLQALHRIRDQLVSSRTRLINQMRAFCLEYGVAIRQGAGVFHLDLPRVLSDESNDLSPAMRRMLAELFEDLARIEQRLTQMTREIEAIAARNDHARRLMTIPGIGPLAATALLAAI
jgi:transposase